MKRMCVTMLCAIVLVAVEIPLPVGAATKYNPCSLLTTAEVEAVLGTKVARTVEGDFAFQGNTTSNCGWQTASPTVTVTLFVGRLPPGFPAVDVGAQTSKQFEKLKQKGGTVQAAVNTHDLWCGRIVQPGASSGPPLAMCNGTSKGFAVTLNIYHEKATGQQAKGLFDKAVSRLR